jgi:hypothetical protein
MIIAFIGRSFPGKIGPMPDSLNLPVPIRSSPLTRLDQFAAIPEEDIWLAPQKSRRTRRAYRLDAGHFMATLNITTSEALRQVDHRAIIAWERMQTGRRGTFDGAPSSRRALPPRPGNMPSCLT